MRQTFITFACIIAMPSIASFAASQKDGEPIILQTGYINPSPINIPIKKSPIQIPLVYQDGNELTFATPCTGCTLQLLDADGEVVYETTVASGTTTVFLPSSLTGTYELRLIYGDIYFYGDINL